MDVTVLSHLTSAAIVVYALQALKQQRWYRRFADRVPIANARIHRLVSLTGALAGAVGIHVATSGNAAAGWHLSIAIPPLWDVLHGAWNVANQFALQQLAYDLVAQKAGALPAKKESVAWSAPAPAPPGH